MGEAVAIRFTGSRGPGASGSMDVHGEVLECDPPRRLSYTFRIPSDPVAVKRKRPSHVTFELKSTGAAVKLTMTHADLLPEDFESDPNAFKGLNNGWPAILSSQKPHRNRQAAVLRPHPRVARAPLVRNECPTASPTIRDTYLISGRKLGTCPYIAPMIPAALTE